MFNRDCIKKLISEYHSLKVLQGHTQQSRGQRFNGLISDMLKCYGINSICNFRTKGEIDVAFELSGKRYILEAKWEKHKIDTSVIAKIQKRVRQRLGGTIGIVLSMSGYSSEALNEAADGEQLSVILLDADHFEAMLCGFIPPDELIDTVVTNASWFGESFTPVKDLFKHNFNESSEIVVTKNDDYDSLLLSSVENFKFTPILSNIPNGQSGIALLSSDKILLTLYNGLFSFDLKTKKIETILSIPNCSRNSIVFNDNIYIVRKHGVACFNNKKISFICGGLVGNVCLFNENSNIWAFSNGQEDFDYSPQLCLIGDNLGQEQLYNLNYPIAQGINATRLNSNEFLILGNNSAIVNLDGCTQYIDLHLTNPMGLGHFDDSTLFVASGSVKLTEIKADDFKSETLAIFNLLGSVSEICMDSKTSGYLFSHHHNSENQSRGIVIHWEYKKSI